MASRFGLAQLTASLRSLCNSPAIASEGMYSLMNLPAASAAPRALTSLLPLCANQSPVAAAVHRASAGGGGGGGSARGYSAAASDSAPEMSPVSRQEDATSSVESIEEIRSRIFGTHIGNGLRSGRKILRRALMGEKLAAYYPENVLKMDPLMPDLKAER